MNLYRLGALAAALLLLPSGVLAQARPPAQRTGPITITGSGSTGDGTLFTATKNGTTLSLGDILGSTQANASAITGFNTSLSALSDTVNTQVGRIDTLNTTLNNALAKLVGKASTKLVYVATDGLDANDGLSPFTPKLTLQAAVNAANPGGHVTVGAGVYTLSAALAMQPGVRLSCVPGAQIVRASGASYASLIEFNTNTANGASVERCALDDGLANNAYNFNNFVVNAYDASDVRIVDNAFTNVTGYGAYVRNGLRPTITRNSFSNGFVAPIAVIPSVASAPVYARITDNRIIGPSGQHAIILNNSDVSLVSGNQILSPLPSLSNVNTSGTTVTWVSGNDFSNVKPGQFMTLNGGAEFLVTAKASSTSLTVNNSPGTLSNTAAVFGDGDLISVANLQSSIVSNNEVYGGGAGGIVASNFIASAGKQQDLGYNQIVGNRVSFSGHACISIQATTTTPATAVYDNAVTGNLLNRCGVGKTANVSTNRTGVSVFDFTGTQGLSRLTVAGNTIRDDLSNTLYGISLQGVANGQVFAGGNVMTGAASNGIGGGANVTLGGGWGSTATVSGLAAFGSSYSFTVTSNGTGQAQFPTITIATPATSLEQPPVQSCKMAGGTGALNFIYGEGNATAASQLIVYNGTPAAGSTYNIFCR